MVTFRPAEMRDVDALYRFRMDDEVMYWASGGYGDAMQSRGQIEEQLRTQKATDAHRTFIIEADAESGPVVIGTIAFRGLDRISRQSAAMRSAALWLKGYAGKRCGR